MEELIDKLKVELIEALNLEEITPEDIPNSPSHSRTVWVSALSPHPGLVKIYCIWLAEIFSEGFESFSNIRHLPIGNRAHTAGFALWTEHFLSFSSGHLFMNKQEKNLTISIRESQQT